MTQALRDFLKRLDVEYKEQFDISRISYIGIGGNAAVMAMPDSSVKLIRLIDFLVEANIRYRVVGAMTNLLPSDSDFIGVLIVTDKINRYSVAESLLTIECGARLSKVINKLSDSGLGGMEELFGIPGTVGGMIYGNAGAYLKAVSDFLIDADIYNPESRRIITLSAEDMNFSYRSSSIKDTDLILLSARFGLRFIPSREVRARLSEISEKRRSAQPYGERSLGSTFKRYGDIPISRLIDDLGFKGFRVGGAEVSKKHAGFIVNSGGATAKDVRALIAIIKEKLYSVYGIAAEEEIEYLE